MRMSAYLRAFAAQAWLSGSMATPVAQVDPMCSMDATETVYMSVGAVEASVSAFGSGPFSLTGSADSTPIETIVPSALAATSGLLSYYSVEPLPPSSLSEPTSVLSTSTVTIPFGSISSTTISAPRISSATTSAASGVVSTFVLTTTITSGYTPQVVETSTYTVIETFRSVASPVAAETTSPRGMPTLPNVGTPSTTSTASFTLTLDTTVAGTPVASVPAASGSSSSLIFTSYVPPTLSSVGGLTTSTLTASMPGESVSAPVETSVGLTTNVFTISLPGSDGVPPTVVTVTAVAPTTYNSPLAVPGTVTETTTISSGVAEIPSPPPGPTTSDVVMTYTVTAPDGAALTTMIMTTEYLYTPQAGVGTSFITVSTATAIETVVVTGTVPAPFPNTTTPNLTTITPPVPVNPSTGVPPSASLPSSNTTVTSNGSAVVTSALAPTGITTLVPSLQPTNGSFLPPAPETSIALTASIETILVNGTAEVTTVFVPVNSSTTIAPVSGSITPLPPVVSANETGSPFLPPGTATGVPGSPASTSLVVPLNSTVPVSSSPTNETSLPTASVIVPTNSSLVPFPVPTNSTSSVNGTSTAPSPGNSQSIGGTPPTASVNGTAPTSARGPTTGNAGPTAPPNGTVPVPPSNQTVVGGPSLSAPLNSTSTPVSNQTITAGPSQSAALNSTLPSPAPNGTSGIVPGQTPPLNSTSTPVANGTSAVEPSPSSSRPSQGGQGSPSQGAPAQSSQGASQGGQGQSQGGQPQSQGSQTHSQGGQGQSQGAQSRSQGQPQSQGAQGQSQGGQSRSQGSQSQSQGAQGQSQGVQGQSQAGQGGAQGGQRQSQFGPGQGGLDQSQTALGLPQSTPSSGPTTLVTSTTIKSRSSPGIKVRAGSPQATAIVTCGKPTDGRDVTLDFEARGDVQKGKAPEPKEIGTLAISNPSSNKRFAWSDGFSVLPAAACPYVPTSGSFLIGFSAPEKVASPVAQIGVGLHQTNPCFRFDFSGFHVGCASKSADCDFNVTGLAWNNDTRSEIAVASHTFHVEACPSQQNCALVYLDGNQAFGLKNLTSLLFAVTADDEPQNWWADDLFLTWTDSTCKSALCRSKIGEANSKHSRHHGVLELTNTRP